MPTLLRHGSGGAECRASVCLAPETMRAYLLRMDTQDLAQALLAACGPLVGLPRLQFESHGCARLLFEDSVAIDLEIDHEARCIQLYSVLGAVPAGNRETLYRRLLESHLFGTHTDGATLALDTTQDEVLLGRRVDLDSATAPELAELLKRFAGVAQQWRDKYRSDELLTGTEHAETRPQLDMYLLG